MIHLKIEIIEKSHIGLLPEVLKFDAICISWSSPKTDLVTTFLNPENRSFEKVSIVTF